ncbi:tyrosine-type recombinase/integrase [Candidatus Woesearchaeota archaeon]|nr:tyrosine-type recombinase/integrase [Candidatus Woesearchaeota archaeon]
MGENINLRKILCVIYVANYEGDLLTESDVKKLVETANYIRDKMLVSILWESGCRIGELVNLRIKDVVFDKHGTILNVFGKTGARTIRLISSTPYVAQWLQIHQNREDRNSYLLINIGNTNKGKRMSYSLVRKNLGLLFKKCGIQKRCNPHSFRHARATFLANHLTEFQMNQYFGWTQGSNMPSTYVHMSGKNTDSALLKIYGLCSEEDKKESMIKPKKCPRCSNLNSFECSFCSVCGSPLDIKTIMELEEKEKQVKQETNRSEKIMQLLLQDSSLREVLLQKLTELKLQSF